MNWDKSSEEKDVTLGVRMIKGDNWTVVDISEHKVVDLQWPTYDHLWMIDENNDKFLSRDQGQTWTRLNRRQEFYHRMRNLITSGRVKLNGIKFGR